MPVIFDPQFTNKSNKCVNQMIFYNSYKIKRFTFLLPKNNKETCTTQNLTTFEMINWFESYIVLFVSYSKLGLMRYYVVLFKLLSSKIVKCTHK